MHRPGELLGFQRSKTTIFQTDRAGALAFAIPSHASNNVGSRPDRDVWAGCNCLAATAVTSNAHIDALFVGVSGRSIELKASRRSTLVRASLRQLKFRVDLCLFLCTHSPDLDRLLVLSLNFLKQLTRRQRISVPECCLDNEVICGFGEFVPAIPQVISCFQSRWQACD